MLRPVLSKAWGLFLLAPLAACSAADGAGASASPSNSQGISPSNDAMGPSIAFLDSDLQFVPGDTREITAVVEPPDVYEVRLSLSGDFGDAFLDRSQVETGTDGMASATLTAPSSAHTFTVRASVGAKSASLPVSAGTGFSNVEVKPHYAGTRAVTTWTATVRTGSSCRSLSGIPASDGPLVADAARDAIPVVADVPVGVPLTVTVRAGHFAGGCADIDGAVAGSARTSVDVTVQDRPLQMGGIALDVALGIDSNPDAETAWNGVAQNLAANFVNHAATDATALLDSMLDKIPSSSADARDAFRTARAAKGWDALLERSLHDGLGAEGLRGLVGSLIREALPKLSRAGIVGTLTSKAGLGLATFEVSEFGGLAPSAIGSAPFGGISSAIIVTWMAAPGDQVLFGGEPKWPLSRLAAALALEPARTRVSDAKSVPDALARTLPCTEVGTLLASDASNPAYADCGAACVQKLCEGALNLMWIRAAYSPEDPTLVDFAATASAKVGDDAKPVSFRGTWVGSLRVGEVIDKVGGTTITTAGAH